jgi:hypothetical protein
LSNCSGITDAGLTYLGNLKEINLSYCHQITDKGLSYLRNVQYLDLHSSLGITDAGLVQLASLGNLKEIYISCDNQLNDAAMTHLKIFRERESRAFVKWMKFFCRAPFQRTAALVRSSSLRCNNTKNHFSPDLSDFSFLLMMIFMCTVPFIVIYIKEILAKRGRD